jgi:hypothetical protein
MALFFVRNGFLARNEFLPNLIKKDYLPMVYNSSVKQFIFSKENFINVIILLNESALLLKVLKRVAHL